MFLLNIFLIVFGGLLSLFGYKLFKVLLPLIGFIIGFTTINSALYPHIGALGTCAALIAGVICGVLSHFFVNFNIALLLAYFAYSTSILVFDENNVRVLSVIIGILAFIAAYAMNLPKYFVVVGTAINGVFYTLAGFYSLFSSSSFTIDQTLQVQKTYSRVIATQSQSFILLFLLLTAGAILFQLQQKEE